MRNHDPLIELRRIAILGGGISARTTALELIAQADQHQKFDIRIYQTWWHPDGKCATTLSPNSVRLFDQQVWRA